MVSSFLLLVLFAPLPGRQSIVFSERLREVELVGIATLIRYRLNWKTRGAQQFGGTGKPLADDKFLRRTSHHLFETATEIVSVQLAERRNLVHGQRPLIVLLNVNHGLMNIVILLSGTLLIPAVPGIFDQLVQKQEQVADQMEWGRSVCWVKYSI